jgi:pyruvate-formate lyase-activating enzyme
MEKTLEEQLMDKYVGEVQTLSIVAGTMACNAKCPDCVSLMTTDPDLYTAFNFTEVDWENFKIALETSINGDAKAVLFTGKGEPTLFPQHIDDYLTRINEHLAENNPGYHLDREMQSNGLIMQHPKFQEKGWLQKWYDNGLDLISLSIVDVDAEVNHEFYNPHQEEYPDLSKTIDMLHDIGYNVRLSVTMMKDRVESPSDIERVVQFAKDNDVE